LDAAVDVFNARGYTGASVEDIADQLGILKGSLYYYISSKEDLLFQIVGEVHEDVQRLLEDSVSRTDLTPLERLALYVRQQVDYNARNLTRISVYYQDIKRLSPARLKEIRARRRSHHDLMTTLIEEAQAQGEVDPTINAALASHCVFGTIIWIYTWYSPRGPVKPPELADFCVRYVLAGIAGGVPAAGASPRVAAVPASAD
jgi:AcrR family transcriptional regulator